MNVKFGLWTFQKLSKRQTNFDFIDFWIDFIDFWMPYYCLHMDKNTTWSLSTQTYAKKSRLTKFK